MQVRANVVTVIAVADLGAPGGLYTLAALAELLDSSVAARLGVLVRQHHTKGRRAFLL